jgi:hypothetical protein
MRIVRYSLSPFSTAGLPRGRFMGRIVYQQISVDKPYFLLVH